MVTLREFTYLEEVCAGGGHKAAVTARIRYGWVKFMEYGTLLYENVSSKTEGGDLLGEQLLRQMKNCS